MARGFRSESVHKVDRKGRVSVPAAFRRILEEGDPDWSSGLNPNLVLVYGGPGGKCLEGYSIDGIAAIDQKIARLPTFSKHRKALERWLNTQSVYVQLDDTGRIVLSARLRAMMDIDAEAVFAGMGQKFEVWAPEEYDTDMREIDIWNQALPEGGSPFDALDALDAPDAGGGA